jgi:hypothetical protein
LINDPTLAFFRSTDRIFLFRIDGRDLLCDLGFVFFKPQTSFVFCCFYLERRIWRRVAPTDWRLRCFSGLRALGSRIPSVFFTQSCQSIDTCPLQSMTLLLLRDFDLLNQIDDPSARFSINDRELLRVFVLFPPFLSSGALDLVLRGLQRSTTQIHFGPSGTSGFGTSNLFLWCYTSRNFGLPKAREPLIQSSQGISTVEN